jgi:hypothetical protein
MGTARTKKASHGTALPRAYIDKSKKDSAFPYITELYNLQQSYASQGIELLQEPTMVWDLARKGYALKIMQAIKKLRQDQQTKILSASSAIWGLCCHDQAEATWSIIKKLNPAQKAQVLSTPDAVRGLASYGIKSAEILAHIKKLKTEQQVQILSAPNAAHALIMNGGIRNVLALIKKFTPEQLDFVSNARGFEEAIKYSGYASHIAMMRKYPKNPAHMDMVALSSSKNMCQPEIY